MDEYDDLFDGELAQIFFEAFEASLNIKNRQQYFSWLQTYCQYIFPHEILICVLVDQTTSQIQYELFTSTRYLTKRHLVEATYQEKGLIPKILDAWKHHQRPILLEPGLAVCDEAHYMVPFSVDNGMLDALELKNVVAHGIAAKPGMPVSFFVFSRVPDKICAKQARLIQLIVPILHTALIRIYEGLNTVTQAVVHNKTITTREQETLKWMHMGKTNAEIAEILNISPLTVKNHVHSILKKLNVQNRSNASIKAFQMGLIRS